MTTVCEKDLCAGCKACADKCPKGAITIEDHLKSYNAVIDEQLCVSCKACYTICPNNQQPQIRQPIAWMQGWASDEQLRARASSGGAALALSKRFIKDGGSVASCVFDKGEFKFRLVSATEDLRAFSGSKYVKSDPSGIYAKIRKSLQLGRRVLFIGLPCQAAAVKKYIGENENLYTVDLICHGTPSPKLLTKYLEQYELKISEMDDILFRKKHLFRVYCNEKSVEEPYIMDFYERAFLGSLSYTDNCYECKFARLERVSDITLGDSWGSELSKEEQVRGVSLLLAQSKKGLDLIQDSELDLFEVDLKKAIASNHQLEHPSVEPKNRKLFFRQVSKDRRFNFAVGLCYPKSCGKQWIKKQLIKAHLLKSKKVF